MTDLKRIASELMKCGKGRVRFGTSEQDVERIKQTATRAGVRTLIAKGIIYAKDIQGISRHRAKKRLEQKRKGRQRGSGSTQSSRKSYEKRVKLYVTRIRSVRDELYKLRKDGTISREEFRQHYRSCRSQGYETRARTRQRVEKMKVLRGEE